MEYGFGAHEFPTSGVFEVEPKSCPGFIYRRSVWMGTTDLSRAEFRSFIENLAGKYNGNTYHLISKNCNHFTDDVCKNLARKSTPGWVNRLARVGWYHQLNMSSSWCASDFLGIWLFFPLYLGSFFNCLLPEGIQVSTVRHVPTHPAFSGEFVPESSYTDLCSWPEFF